MDSNNNVVKRTVMVVSNGGEAGHLVVSEITSPTLPASSHAMPANDFFVGRKGVTPDGCGVTAQGEEEVCSEAFRDAMRDLAGGVTVVTVGKGDDITGFTATAVNSLSANPPRVIVCISKGSSSFTPLDSNRSFAVNIIGSGDQAIADQFAGKGGLKGAQRYGDAEWTTMYSGTPILSASLAALDCEVDEVIERYDHAIVIGRVRAIRIFSRQTPLVYWQGGYQQLVSSPELIGGLRNCSGPKAVQYP
ncbi:flavin reductase family protein [Undibacterium sp. TJN25]|uniref:flavin reductase family protein n=1 Tax=Undibacterium sp. TJN25 TaxID=3413056 RepID=UPI003BF29CFD